MFYIKLLYIALLLQQLRLGLSKPAAKADEDDDCEINAPDTMHDFCCELHDENPHFAQCELDWHGKIHYKNDKEEQVYMFCTAECTLNSTDFLKSDRQSLNLKRVRVHLEEELADEADEALLYETYVKCSQHALELMQHKAVQDLSKRLAKYNCHPYPGLLMECVSNQMIINCPPKRFLKKPACHMAREYLRDCLQHNKYKS